MFMKSNLKLFSLFFIAGMTMFVSCDDKNTDPDGPEGNGDGNQNWTAPSDFAQGASKKYVENPEEVQSVKIQQQQLEATAIALANHHKSVNFSDVIELARYANDNYIDKEGYDDDPVSDFFDNAMDLITTNNLNPVKHETYNSESAYWYDYDYDYETGVKTYKCNFNRYEERINGYFIQLFQASKFFAHFQANKNGWVQEPGTFNDLQFTFNDKNGNPCVLTAKVSGAEQIVYVTQNTDNWEFNSYDREWVEKDTVLTIYDWEDDERVTKNVKVDGYYYYHSLETFDVNDIKVSVPEHVSLTLTQNGKTLISSEVEINLSGIENERININKTALGFKMKTKVAGTEFVINKFDYKNGSESDYSMYSTLNGKKLYEISGKYLSNINFKGDQNYQYIEDLMDDVYDDYDKNVKAFSGVEANVNILGDLQIKALVSDAKKLIDLIDEAYDNDKNESIFKSKVEEINKNISLGLYYYGGSKLQAKLRLEAFEDADESWVYDENGGHLIESNPYWDFEPVIEFSNGQTYSIDEFFNEDDFRSLVDLIEEIGDDYEDELDF